MKFRRSIIVTALVSLAAAPHTARVLAPALSPSEKTSVYDMKVVIRETPNPDEAGKTYDAIGLLHGTLDQAAAVLWDFARYPEFMPNVSATEIVRRDEQTATVNYTLRLPLGKVKKYRLNLWRERSENMLTIGWNKVPWEGLKESETIADARGSWTVTPSEMEGRLLAVHHAHTDPGKIPTGLGWIVNILTKDSLPEILKATRSRIDSLYYDKPK